MPLDIQIRSSTLSDLLWIQAQQTFNATCLPSFDSIYLDDVTSINSVVNGNAIDYTLSVQVLTVGDATLNRMSSQDPVNFADITLELSANDTFERPEEFVLSISVFRHIHITTQIGTSPMCRHSSLITAFVNFQETSQAFQFPIMLTSS